MKRVMFGVSVAAAVLSASVAFAQTAPSSVSMWLVNPYGDVDGVMLRDGRSLFFTTDIGRMVTASVRIGDTVHVDTSGGRRILVDERDGSQLDLTSPPRGGGPVGIPALQRITARGNVTAFLRTPEGGVAGFVLASGEHVRVPTTMGARLAGVRVGDMLVVEGLGNRGRWGLGVQAMSVHDSRGQLILRR